MVMVAQNPFVQYAYRLKSVSSNDLLESRNFYYDSENCLTDDWHVDIRNGNPDVRDSLFYDDHFNVVRRAAYQISYGDVWYCVSYCDYTYNELGQRLTRKNYNYNFGEYKLGGTYTYTYNGQGDMVHWDLELGSMGLYQQCDLTYDHEHHCLTELVYQEGFYGMEESYKVEYHYDAGGNLVERLGWFANNGGWFENGHKVWLRNAENDVTVEYSYSGNDIIEQHEYGYGLSLLTDDVLPRVNPEDEWPVLPKTRNVIVSDTYSVRQNGSLQYVCDYYYEYEPFTYDAVAEAKADDVRLYPNPVRDFVTIEAEGYQHAAIYDLSGKCIKEIEVNGEVGIETKDMPKGMYFVKLVGEKGILTKKMLVE